jgi:hypothetical protein
MKQKIITMTLFLILVLSLSFSLIWLTKTISNNFDSNNVDIMLFDKKVFFKCHIIC